MTRLDTLRLPDELAVELERRYFWWEPIGHHPRSHARILAQAMNQAPYEDIRQLERTLGSTRLAEVMIRAEPGWFNERSWEFWRGRLALETDQIIPHTPPRRAFDAG